MSRRGSGAVTMAVTEPILRLPQVCLYLVYLLTTIPTSTKLDFWALKEAPGLGNMNPRLKKKCLKIFCLMANSSIIKTMSESNRRWKIPSRFPTELISSSRTSIRRGSAITRLKLTHLRLLRAAYTGIWNHLSQDCCNLNLKCIQSSSNQFFPVQGKPPGLRYKKVYY